MKKKTADIARRAPRRARPVGHLARTREALQRRWSRLMSEPEVKFLRDVQAFIDFAISNGMTFTAVVGTLLNDLNEITRDGFDYGKALSRGFEPEVSKYSQLTSDDFGESDEESGA